MELRDITNEYSLLKSYKTVFVDNQKTELLGLYHKNKRRFPVFGERIFSSPGATPVSLIDYKMRVELEDGAPGRIFILERTDNPADSTRTRLFWVWISPDLQSYMASQATGEVKVQAHVLFHPFGNLNEYPAYWRGGIEPLKVPNFLELGARYLCKEKQTVAQHFCAVRKDSKTTPDGFADKKCTWQLMVVIPVSRASSFASLGDPKELQETLEQIARRCHEGVSAKLLPSTAMNLERVAVSGYSRSGAILQNLLAGASGNNPFLRSNLKEVYAFDVMLDQKGTEKSKPVSKKEGYETFWSNLKTWQSDDSDKKIRLYSSEPNTVSGIYAEFKERLQRYGGGYHRPSVPFSAFNGKSSPDGKLAYSGLSDGYEIYSTDNSRSLVVLPSNNSLVYLSSDNIANPNGFAFDADYEPGLEGHSWFVSRLASHALFHSGF